MTKDKTKDKILGPAFDSGPYERGRTFRRSKAKVCNVPKDDIDFSGNHRAILGWYFSLDNDKCDVVTLAYQSWSRIMLHSRLAMISIALLVPLTLPACGGGGSKTETKVQNTTVSQGQQLIDLKSALDSGAISQKEYEEQRKKVLNK
jgi:hypothetical protein